ncbi:MAG TPA: diaminopropionate ammonia-lyase [Streptomyces sp.]|nr:diaminopropionate ammonia-lyase [Streptomyces sp.]
MGGAHALLRVRPAARARWKAAGPCTGTGMRGYRPGHDRRLPRGLTMDVYFNEAATDAVPDRPPSPRWFHRRLPGYRPSPLVRCPELAALLHVGEVWVKDESKRLGLPSFKMLGASWATYRALEERARGAFGDWNTFGELQAGVAALGPLTLACATDGNHGLAVARMARLLGLSAHVLVPAGVAPARIDAIADEGARVETVHSTYDEAVAKSAELADDDTLVISDTSWPGYERIPRWAIEGYATIFEETDEQLSGHSADHVVVQMGVGALAAAVTRHFRGGQRPARVIGVEPADAACVMKSLACGVPTGVPGPHTSVMDGLNCGLPSGVAWPALREGLDATVTVDDDATAEAMRRLAELQIDSGPSGAAGLAGITSLLSSSYAEEARERLELSTGSSVLLISTEGPTVV